MDGVIPYSCVRLKYPCEVYWNPWPLWRCNSAAALFWVERTTSSAGGLPSYALAKSYERSELTTYQARVTQKSEIEEALPVYGRQGTRCRRKIFDAS